MAIPNAQQAADNWARGMSGSGEKFKAGVQAVTESPMDKAADASDRMVQGIIQAQAEGRIQAGLRRVSLAEWKAAMLDKGAARIASGANAAKPRVVAFMQAFLPYLANGVAQLSPRGDLEANIQRSVQMQRYNAQFKRQRMS